MSDSRSKKAALPLESKQDSNIPFRELPKEIQEHLVLKQLILEKDWDSYPRDKQQIILDEYSLQTTVNYSNQNNATVDKKEKDKEIDRKNETSADILPSAILKIIFDQLQERCDIFLMAPPESHQHKVSNKNNLYLYQDEEGKMFYKLCQADKDEKTNKVIYSYNTYYLRKFPKKIEFDQTENEKNLTNAKTWQSVRLF